MLIATDFFRIAHDDVTGRPIVHRSPLDLGLAAGLVAELMWAQAVYVQHGLLLLATPPVSLPDVVSQSLYERLLIEGRQHDVSRWLTTLSATCYEQVAARLVCSGQVRPTTVRRLLRTQVRYVPTDMKTAAMPMAGLSWRLRHRHQLDHRDLFLAALAQATGLIGRVLDGADRDATANLEHALTLLPAPLAELVTHTEALVGVAVLAYQRR